MSPHAANSLVHDLVQMAQAMEQLPQVQADLESTRNELNSAYDRIQRLELRLMDRSIELDEARAEVRRAEVSRDDAELRFLEADDRTMRAVEFIKAQFGAAGSLIQALEPAKPQPPVEETVQSAPISYETLKAGGHLIETAPEGQSEIPLPQSPISTTIEGSTPEHGGTGSTDSGTSVPINAEGQSAADPTPVETASVLPQSPVAEQDAVSLPSSDPEPTERWSTEWWQWRDRQCRDAE